MSGRRREPAEMPYDMAIAKLHMMLNFVDRNWEASLFNANKGVRLIAGREYEYGQVADDFHQYRIACLINLGRRAEAEAGQDCYEALILSYLWN